MSLSDLILSEELQLKKLQDLVSESIKEEQLLTSKLVEAEQDLDITLGQRLADYIADFGGSWTFIILFAVVIIVWILVNALAIQGINFDPFPFILLNLVLSCLAALQAPVIMMSQKRQEEKDRRRSRNDYLVNLKAEIEVRNLHSKMDLLMMEQMKSLFDVQKTQLEILNKLEQKIDQLNSGSP